MKQNGHVKIDKGIPVPIVKRGREISTVGRAMKTMRKGDSILLTPKKYMAAVQLARRHIGIGKYALRFESSGYRVWRTK